MSFDITEALGVEGDTYTQYTNTNFLFNFAIAGLPFLAAIRDDIPLERGFAQVRRQQLDTAQVAGEQSLSNWWLRSQFTFTGGAGQELYEPAQDEAVRTRFSNSQGVDPWTDGQVSLLNATDVVTATASCRVAGASASGTDYLMYANGTNTVRWNGTSGANTTGTSGVHTWLWPMGDKVLGCFNGGIDIIDVATNNVTAAKTVVGTPKCWFVKGRIIAAVGSALYEITNLTAGAFPAAMTGTGSNTSWTWTSATETPDAILVSGYSGSKGAILKLTLDATDGTLPVLTSPTVVLEFPQGEIPTSLMGYLGSYVAIGTNKGLRIATVGSQGQLQLGALTIETTSSIDHMTAKDRFFYVGVSGGQPDGTSGLARVDLSEPDRQGRYPYAWDVTGTDSGTVTGVTQFGTTGRMVFASTSLWCESATVLVAQGWLDTSQVLYGTLEPKQFMFAELKATYPGGTINLSSIVGDSFTGATYTSLLDYSESNKDEITRLPADLMTKLGLRFTLNRDSDDTTLGPVVTGWQLKALPAITRQEIVKVPLLCYDSERDAAGNLRRADAWDRFTALVDATSTAATVTFQNLDTGEIANCVVEDLGFTQYSPPKGFDGFGGIATITLRKV